MNSARLALMLSSVLDNQKQSDGSIELYQSKLVKKYKLQGYKSCQVLHGSYSSAELEYAFLVGESEIAVLTPDISQTL
jgi:hypothetical protein